MPFVVPFFVSFVVRLFFMPFVVQDFGSISLACTATSTGAWNRM
jgi:hypothetical protein